MEKTTENSSLSKAEAFLRKRQEQENISNANLKKLSEESLTTQKQVNPIVHKTQGTIKENKSDNVQGETRVPQNIIQRNSENKPVNSIKSIQEKREEVDSSVFTVPQKDIKNKITTENRLKSQGVAIQQEKGNTIKELQQIAKDKLSEQRKNVYGTKDSVQEELKSKIESLEKEKEKYKNIGKELLVGSIEKKIEAYKKTDELILSGKLDESDIHKLHKFIEKDVDNLAPEVKQKQYDLVSQKLEQFNKKKDLAEKKNEVKEDVAKLEKAKNIVDKAMDNIVIDVKQNTVSLEKEIGQLMARNEEGDKEKAKELAKRVEEYKKFEGEVDKLNDGEKKGLVMFLQSDEQKAKFLEQENIKGITSDSLIGEATGMIEKGVISTEILRETGTNLVKNKAYSLFSEFGTLKNSIPGLGNLKATDNIDEAVSNIKGYTLTEDDKAKIEALKLIQRNINNFSEIQKDVLSEVNKRAFLEQRMALEFELNENKKYLNSELAKIDMMDFSDEEKTKQKEMLISASSKQEHELNEKLRVLNEGSNVLQSMEGKELISKEELEKLGNQTDILAITHNEKYSSMLQALAKEGIDGRMIGGNIEIQPGQLMDTSLLTHLRGNLSAIKSEQVENFKDRATTELKEFKDVFVGKKGETALEREERFKTMDVYLSTGATGIVGSFLLFFYRMFEIVVNSVEKLPVLITKSTNIIERNRAGIFVSVSIFILILTVGFSGGDGNNFVELNTKLFSMSNYSFETTGNLRYTDNIVQNFAQRGAILTFLMSLIVLYQIIIEIMNRYINFLRSGDDKGNVDGFVLSIMKGALFVAFIGFVFKIFV